LIHGSDQHSVAALVASEAPRRVPAIEITNCASNKFRVFDETVAGQRRGELRNFADWQV
jgi:hypothetical protein